jgi:hypothetical protein
MNFFSRLQQNQWRLGLGQVKKNNYKGSAFYFEDERGGKPKENTYSCILFKRKERDIFWEYREQI